MATNCVDDTGVAVAPVVQCGHTDVMGEVTIINPRVEGAQCMYSPDSHGVWIGIAVVVVGDEYDILPPCTIVIDSMAGRDDDSFRVSVQR